MKHKVLIALFENGFVIYFCLCQVFVAACKLSLVAVSGGCSPVVMCRLLVLVASLVAQHRLCVAQACSIFLDQRLNLRWQVDSSPLDHRGSPPYSSQSHKTKTNWSSKYKIKLDSFHGKYLFFLKLCHHLQCNYGLTPKALSLWDRADWFYNPRRKGQTTQEKKNGSNELKYFTNEQPDNQQMHDKMPSFTTHQEETQIKKTVNYHVRHKKS